MDFNSKYFNILVVLILIYIAYIHFKKNQIFFTDNNNAYCGEDALIKIEIDPGKKYEDYNFIEKFLYNKYKDKIDSSFRNKGRKMGESDLDITRKENENHWKE